VDNDQKKKIAAITIPGAFAGDSPAEK